ncbi:1,4-dihydroxy-6-naphthoate synthase [Neorhodopirellula lusitana]|uniref:1,4-dihydroxy-6-naphthoate synthase n=1 Tax=Neorhodopirellula lusitana TaxID=445327 RepID=UPI00384F5652
MSDGPTTITVGTGKRMHLGISTCPNDTFAFAALLEGRVDTLGYEFVIDLLDIDELNQGLDSGRFDVLKASFHAALHHTHHTVVLPVGSAIGFGVGPLLLASKPNSRPESADQLALCPGARTTAKLLWDLFYRDTARVEHVVFSEIMPRLAEGSADFGVCIHEGRFTYEQSGLHCVEDLGERWEATTKCPLPLGGLLMRTQHPDAMIKQVSQVVSSSLAVARQTPDSALPAMRRYAQSLDDAVLMQHVELYVNAWTESLEGAGAESLKKLSELAKNAGMVGDKTPDLRILGV